jgi:Tfp pilus assembly protein PilF
VKKSDFIGVVLMLGLALSGCISTTTGTPAPEADEADAAELNYQLGARYYQNQKYELARDRLMLAIELDPKMAKAYTTLGMTYEAIGNLRLATEWRRETSMCRTPTLFFFVASVTMRVRRSTSPKPPSIRKMIMLSGR